MNETPSSELPPNERPRPASPPLPPVSYQSVRVEDHDWRAHRRDLLGPLFWAAILVMAGLVLLADNMGLLPTLGGADAWDWIMLNAGGLLLIQQLVRAISPGSTGPETFWVIAGLVLVGLGASAIFGVPTSILWPAGLIVIGVLALLRALRH